MQTPWTPPLRWVFGTATVLGLFSSLQAWRLRALSSPDAVHGSDLLPIVVLNLAFWYIPAAACPAIFALVRRYRIDQQRLHALGVHAGAAFMLVVVHAVGMTVLRAAFWGAPSSGWFWALQRNFLTNLDWLLMTYTAVVGVTYAFGYYREVQARSLREAQLQTRLVEARLRTLEAELHPHFLFNTLHAISTLLHTNPDSADRMISRLSDLLRLTFDRSGAATVPLQEELEFLQKYLEIEEVRFQDRLTVRYDIDPATLHHEVPRLILQPLVENAIKHGVSPRMGPGVVQVSSRIEGDRLWLEVRDDGLGLRGAAPLASSRGVGLGNTRDRLEWLYGAAGRLEFAEPGTGLAVRLVLPLRASTAAPPSESRVA